MSYGVLNLLKILEVQKVFKFIYEHNTYAHFLNVTLVIKPYPFVLSSVFLFSRYFFKCFTFACIHYHLSNLVGLWVIFNLLNKSKIWFKSFHRLKVASNFIQLTLVIRFCLLISKKYAIKKFEGTISKILEYCSISEIDGSYNNCNGCCNHT